MNYGKMYMMSKTYKTLKSLMSSQLRKINLYG